MAKFSLGISTKDLTGAALPYQLVEIETIDSAGRQARFPRIGSALGGVVPPTFYSVRTDGNGDAVVSLEQTPASGYFYRAFIAYTDPSTGQSAEYDKAFALTADNPLHTLQRYEIQPQHPSVDPTLTQFLRFVQDWAQRYADGHVVRARRENLPEDVAYTDDVLGFSTVRNEAIEQAMAALARGYTLLFGTATPDANSKILDSHVTAREVAERSAIIQQSSGTFTWSSPARQFKSPAAAISLPAVGDADWIIVEIADTQGAHEAHWIDLDVLHDAGLPAVAAGDAVSTSNGIIITDSGSMGNIDLWVGKTSDNNLLMASGQSTGETHVQVYRVGAIGTALSAAEVNALIAAATKAFAQAGSTDTPDAADLAADPTVGKVLKVAADLSAAWEDETSGQTEAEVEAIVRRLDKGIKFVGSPLPPVGSYNAGDLAWVNGDGLYEVVAGSVASNSLPAEAWTPSRLTNTMLYGFDRRTAGPGITPFGSRPAGWPAGVLSLFRDNANTVWLYAVPGTFGTSRTDAVEITANGVPLHLPYLRTANGYDHYAVGPLSNAPWSDAEIQVAIHALGGVTPFLSATKDWSKQDSFNSQTAAKLLAGGREADSQIAWTQNANHELIATIKPGVVAAQLPDNLKLLDRNVVRGGWRAEPGLDHSDPQGTAYTEQTATAETYQASTNVGTEAVNQNMAMRIPKSLFAVQPTDADLALIRISTGDDGAEVISTAGNLTYLGDGTSDGSGQYWYYNFALNRIPAGSILAVQWDAATELDHVDIDADDIRGLDVAVEALQRGEVQIHRFTEEPTHVIGYPENTLALVDISDTPELWIVGEDQSQAKNDEVRSTFSFVLDGATHSADFTDGAGAITNNTAANGMDLALQVSLEGNPTFAPPGYKLSLVLQWQGLSDPAPTAAPTNFFGQFRRHGSSDAWATIGERFVPSQPRNVTVLGTQGVQWEVNLTQAEWNAIQNAGGIDFRLARDQAFTHPYLFHESTGLVRGAWERVTNRLVAGAVRYWADADSNIQRYDGAAWMDVPLPQAITAADIGATIPTNAAVAASAGGSTVLSQSLALLRGDKVVLSASVQLDLSGAVGTTVSLVLQHKEAADDWSTVATPATEFYNTGRSNAANADEREVVLIREYAATADGTIDFRVLFTSTDTAHRALYRVLEWEILKATS